MIGDEHAMQGEGMIHGVAVVIQGHTIRFPVLVLPIAGSDIVSGASWLATLGPHVDDYTIGSAKLQFLHESSFTLRVSTGPTVA